MQRVVLEDEVLCIITNTKVNTPEEWERVMREYARRYWHRDPARAIEIANMLKKQGKIIQPRVAGLPFPSEFWPGVVWLSSDGAKAC
jgi:hypothetical protein